MPAPVNSPSTPPAASDGPLRLGVIGCGKVFERLHLPAISRSSDVRLVSVCEPDPSRRTWATEVVPDAGAFADVETLLTESELHAVLVCTPPASHAGIALIALERGLHVLSEKPLATSSADARAIVTAARHSNRTVVVGFNRRFRRTYQALRARLADSGEAKCHLRYVFQADSDRWNRARTEVGSESGTAGSDADGILSDVASHQLDLVPWIAGRDVESVRARVGSPEIGGRAVTIDVRLEGGIEAELHAGYGRGYSERLEVPLPDRRLVAYPGVLLDPRWIGASLVGGQRFSAVVERGVARVSEAGGHLLRRAVGRPGLTLESVDRQLSCFAARVRAAPPEVHNPAVAAEGVPRWLEDGADERDGMRCAAAVEACLSSLATAGRWELVQP